MEIEDMNQSFICFRCENFLFLFSLMDVEKICAYRTDIEQYGEDIPIFSLRGSCEGRTVFLVLHHQNGYYALELSEILGIRQCDPRYQFEVPEELTGDREEICGIFVWEEEQCIGYLLDSQLFYENYRDKCQV